MRTVMALVMVLAGGCHTVVELYPELVPPAGMDAAVVPDAAVASTPDALAAPDAFEDDAAVPDAGENGDAAAPPSCVCRRMCRTAAECSIISRTSACGADNLCTGAGSSCTMAAECDVDPRLWLCAVDERSMTACP